MREERRKYIFWKNTAVTDHPPSNSDKHNHTNSTPTSLPLFKLQYFSFTSFQVFIFFPNFWHLFAHPPPSPLVPSSFVPVQQLHPIPSQYEPSFPSPPAPLLHPSFSLSLPLTPCGKIGHWFHYAQNWVISDENVNQSGGVLLKKRRRTCASSRKPCCCAHARL